MKWVLPTIPRETFTVDSLYNALVRYRYYNADGWLGYNINWKDFTIQQESDKLRKLISIRLINQKFQDVPEIYKDNYYWQYPDLSAVLTTLTFYRQNFYKTQYVYGFGHNEDIPEGLFMSFTSGFTIKQRGIGLLLLLITGIRSLIVKRITSVLPYGLKDISIKARLKISIWWALSDILII